MLALLAIYAQDSWAIGDWSSRQDKRNLNRYEDQVDDFQLVLGDIADKRAAVEQAPLSDAEVVYEYDATKIKGGFNYLLSPLFSSVWQAKNPNQAVLEAHVMVKKLRVYIAHGALFSTTSGQYVVDMAFDVDLYTPKNEKVGRLENITYKNTKNRYFIKGRQPSAEQDEVAIYDLLKESVNELAEKIDDKVR